MQITKAMVMAAGMGTRMHPLTGTMPKPLVPFAGKPLIDHVLDRLEDAGIEEVIVNVHHFADMLEAHLAKRKSPVIVISDERTRLLDTGGGVRKALPLLGSEPVITFNSDSVWTEGAGSNLRDLMAAFDPARMDALLMVADTACTIGYTGKGAIHPRQIAALNEIYSPSAAQIDHARRIVAAFAATDSGLVVVDGKLIEKPVLRTMHRILAVADRAGN